MDKGPERDLVGELGKALKKHGLKYAPSYHRERHDTFFAKKLYVANAVPQDDIAEEIRRVPEAATLYGPFGLTKEFVDDYVARWKEIQTKYQPDFLWIDDIPIWTRDGNQVLKGKANPEVQYFYDQCRLMITDFMNDGAARGAEVYVNNKGGNRNWPDGVGCLEKDNLKLKVIGPKWESCTTFGTSFGYLAGDRYKSIENVIHEMVEVISRNGNFLVNIGPKPDGTIPEPQMERLMAMKSWLKINGEAIYGTRYWKVSGQKNEHLAFTTKGKTLYAIKLKEPTSAFTIEDKSHWITSGVKSVRLLGHPYPAAVDWSIQSGGLNIKPPSNLGKSKYAWVFEIVTNREQHLPNVIEDDASKVLGGTGEVDLDGHDPGVMSNKPGVSVAIETADTADGFTRFVPRKQAVAVSANRKTNNDAVASLTDGQIVRGIGPVFSNNVRNGAYKMDLGAVRPVSGITSWSHNWKGVRGSQKVVLYGSDAVNDPGWDLRKYTPLGTIDTGGKPGASFIAASLRVEDGKSLGKFRWVVWAVLPAVRNGIAENTAFQELAVEAGEPIK